MFTWDSLCERPPLRALTWTWIRTANTLKSEFLKPALARLVHPSAGWCRRSLSRFFYSKTFTRIPELERKECEWEAWIWTSQIHTNVWMANIRVHVWRLVRLSNDIALSCQFFSLVLDRVQVQWEERKRSESESGRQTFIISAIHQCSNDNLLAFW